MRNQPRYHLLKNARYALEGLRDAFKGETSFRIEVILFVLFSVGFWLSPLHMESKAFLQASLFIPLIVELLNSAIERVVDLATKELHPLAKQAKDMGAAAVLLSLFLTLCIWIGVFCHELGCNKIFLG